MTTNTVQTVVKAASLIELQRGLRDHLLAGDADARAPGLTPRADPGLAVYRHAYRSQLIACLRDTFEKTWAWLGDENFDAAALGYVEAHPPASWTLADYGQDFANTLRDVFPDDPEISELAWLDWTLRRAFDGQDAEAVDPAGLAGVDWEAAILAFPPTLVVRDVTTNCAAIWGALEEGETPPAAEVLPAPASICTWRTGFSSRYRTMDPLEARALAQAAEGRTFAEVCAELAVEIEDGPAVLGGILAAWLREGLVSAVL